MRCAASASTQVTIFKLIFLPSGFSVFPRASQQPGSWSTSTGTRGALPALSGAVIDACQKHLPCNLSLSRSQDVVPRRTGLPQSEQLCPGGQVGARRPPGRGHDGPVRGLRAAHPGPLPAQRAGPRLARQVRPVLRLQPGAHGEVLLQGRQALLQNGLFPVRAKGSIALYLFK